MDVLESFNITLSYFKTHRELTLIIIMTFNNKNFKKWLQILKNYSILLRLKAMRAESQK